MSRDSLESFFFISSIATLNIWGLDAANILIVRLMAGFANRKSPDLCLLAFYVFFPPRKANSVSWKEFLQAQNENKFLIAFYDVESMTWIPTAVRLYSPIFWSIQRAPTNVIKSIIFRTCFCGTFFLRWCSTCVRECVWVPRELHQE